jgi:Fuc2NAc and GlcNAc transferase
VQAQLTIEALIATSAFVATAILTHAVRLAARRVGLIDIPSARSSHTYPTPRGGGVAIAVVVLAGTIAIALLLPLDAKPVAALLVCGAMIAWVGFIDDRNGLSARFRLVAHFVVVLPTVFFVGGLPDLSVGTLRIPYELFGVAIAGVGAVWFLNLFNFMDGIDGIAASQAVFISGAALLLGRLEGLDEPASALLVPLAAASAGFLLLNWAPAKIFMGDVGSGYLGVQLAILALLLSNLGYLSIWTWLILASVFIADATATLVVRMVRGENWATPHRTHLYQRLAVKWRSHSRVALVYMLVNVGCVLPVAWLSQEFPALAPLFAFCLLATLVGLVVALGGGRQPSSA